MCLVLVNEPPQYQSSVKIALVSSTFESLLHFIGVLADHYCKSSSYRDGVRGQVQTTAEGKFADLVYNSQENIFEIMAAFCS